MKKLIYNIGNHPTLMSWAAHFTQFASAVFVLPLVLVKFPREEVAYWLLLGTIVDLAMLADTGFGPTLIRAVSFLFAGADKLPENKTDFANRAGATGKPNLPQLAQLYSTTSLVYLTMGAIVCLLLGSVGLFIVWNVIQLGGHEWYLWASYAAVVASTFIRLQNVRLSSFLSGLDMVAKWQRLRTVMNIFKIIGFLVALLSGGTVFHLSLTILVTVVITNAFLSAQVHGWFRRHSAVRIPLLAFDKSLFSTIWSSTWKLGGVFWGNYFIQYGSSLVVSQVQDAGLMASFLLARRIIGFLRNVALAPFYSHVPRIYHLIAEKLFDKGKRLVSWQVFVSIVVAVAGTGGFIFFGEIALDFLGVESVSMLPALYIAIMSLAMMLEIHAAFHATIYLSTNQVPFFIPSLVTGAVIVGGGAIIYPYYGVLGVVVLPFAAQLVFNNWFAVVLSLRLLNWPFGEYVGSVAGAGVRRFKRDF